MKTFKLDSRLDNDCFILSESNQFLVLLMDNSLVPWFILVPKTDKTELYELDKTMQSKVLTVINQLSDFLMKEFSPDKLNVAAIGNIVDQMHIHIVGRYATDVYWPGVVWGATEKKPYIAVEVDKLRSKLDSILEI